MYTDLLNDLLDGAIKTGDGMRYIPDHLRATHPPDAIMIQLEFADLDAELQTEAKRLDRITRRWSIAAAASLILLGALLIAHGLTG